LQNSLQKQALLQETFANQKVKGVFLPTTQKIGFLQLPFLRDQQSARPDRPLETESAWHPDHCGKKLSRRIRSEST
jgi:hypothetical protein